MSSVVGNNLSKGGGTDVFLTEDVKSEPYIHGEPWDAGYSIELVYYFAGYLGNQAKDAA